MLSYSTWNGHVINGRPLKDGPLDWNQNLDSVQILSTKQKQKKKHRSWVLKELCHIQELYEKAQFDLRIKK